NDCNDYDLNITIQGAPPANMVPYCFGDGSGAACPCNNNSSPGHNGGCAHAGGEGAVLVGIGDPSVSSDTLHMDLTGASMNSYALLLSADNQRPIVGGCAGCGSPAFDGLSCAGGNMLRHGSRFTNASGNTVDGWGDTAGPAGGLISAGGFTSGQTRHFFAMFRTGMAATCMSGQNSSNGISVTMLP
ncbi:MAG: hypothetical protein AAF368_13160, partial [Planctomycetota bacterium]